jgi:CheY-like chemotaxis protein
MNFDVFANKNILIVDDEKINLKILQDTINSKYSSSIATNGVEAFELLEKNNYDLILLDIIMPNMNGFEFCEKIKTYDKYKSIPIIFITSLNDDDSIEKAYNMGAVDYITKPFKNREIMARVYTHLCLSEKREQLQKRIDLEVEKNIAQEKIILQKTKIAALSNIMDSVAHQWKQPVSIINILVNKLELQSRLNVCTTQEEIVKITQDIKKQTNHMIDTLYNFRRFFRNDQNRKELNIKSQIDGVLELLSEIIEDNKININLNCDNNLTYKLIESDFKHIFINLINNARDAFNEKNINNRKIDINLYKKDSNIYIEVNDNAGGMNKDNEDNLDIIFESDFTTKAESLGTGVGLYLSKKIVEKIDGSIHVENLYDEDNLIGLSFKITLPILD